MCLSADGRPRAHRVQYDGMAQLIGPLSGGVIRIRFKDRRSAFLSACHTSSPVLFLLSILPLYSRKCKSYSFFLSCIRQLFKQIALRYTSNSACINTVCIQVYDQVSCRSVLQFKTKGTVF